VKASSGRVLLTGATRGIGRAVFEALLARGASIAAVARDDETLARLRDEAPERVHPFAIDLSDPSARRDLVSRAVSALGAIDAFVSCAGIARHRELLAVTEADLAHHLEVNFVAPFFLSRDVAAHVKARGAPASIVLVGSTLAMRPAPLTAAYAASKGALHAAARALALELAPHGVRVNAVAPGVVDTEMVRVPRLHEGEPEPAGEARAHRIDAELAALRALHPLGRLGEPGDVAGAVLHLLDAEWTTGTTLVVDGGLTAR
jgi:NAD(P)-dependent dehydrogenase (short-subunit alcohol dehydrogenase family)